MKREKVGKLPKGLVAHHCWGRVWCFTSREYVNAPFYMTAPRGVEKPVEIEGGWYWEYENDDAEMDM